MLCVVHLTCAPLVSLYADKYPTHICGLLRIIMCPCSNPLCDEEYVFIIEHLKQQLRCITLLELLCRNFTTTQNISLFTHSTACLPQYRAMASFFSSCLDSYWIRVLHILLRGLDSARGRHTHIQTHTKGVVKHEPSCPTTSLSHLAQHKCAGNALGLIGLNACTCHCSMAGIEC